MEKTAQEVRASQSERTRTTFLVSESLSLTGREGKRHCKEEMAKLGSLEIAIKWVTEA